MNSFAFENPVVDRVVSNTSALDDKTIVRPIVKRCTRQVLVYTALENGVPFADDALKQDAMTANIQRLTTASLHLAYRWVRADTLGTPQTPHEAFGLLRPTDRIPQSVRDKLHTSADECDALIDLDHTRHPDLLVRFV